MPTSDLRPPTRKVGIGIGIETHIFSIPIPSIFMGYRVRHERMSC